MWISMLDGFFSVVESEGDATKVVVRARVRSHLVALRRFVPTLGRIAASPLRDYPFRSVVSKVEFAAGLSKAVIEGLTYTNHKRAVGERDPFRAQVLGRAWVTFRELQDGAPPR